jgi:hypothetical protein
MHDALGWRRLGVKDCESVVRSRQISFCCGRHVTRPSRAEHPDDICVLVRHGAHTREERRGLRYALDTDKVCD